MLTKIGQRLRNLGYIARDRLSDEERIWLGATEEEGLNLNPDLYRQEVQPEGAKYVKGMIVDARDVVHDPTSVTKCPENK